MWQGEIKHVILAKSEASGVEGSKFKSQICYSGFVTMAT